MSKAHLKREAFSTVVKYCAKAQGVGDESKLKNKQASENIIAALLKHLKTATKETLFL